jgi:hypothetical protein
VGAWILAAALASAGARAETPEAPSDALASARALFADALRDESAGRFGAALEKFQRVREVRDTAAIEYRIGTCQEGLGQPAPAFASYRAAVALGRDEPSSTDVVQAASARLAALGDRVGRLTLVFAPPAPHGTEVRVDGEMIPPPALVEPIVVAPGSHEVTATAPEAAPYRGAIALTAGAQVSLTIALAPPVAESAPAPAPEVTRPGGGGSTTVGWITAGAGVALVATSVVLLIARHDAIADLDRQCPGGVCPAGADKNNLDATRNRALLEGPLALGFAAGGVVAAGVGVYLLAAAHASAPAAVSAAEASAIVPLVGPGGAGVAWTAAFQ